jgi:hypothetical protein
MSEPTQRIVLHHRVAPAGRSLGRETGRAIVLEIIPRQAGGPRAVPSSKRTSWLWLAALFLVIGWRANTNTRAQPEKESEPPPPPPPPVEPAEPPDEDRRMGERLVRKAATDADEDLMESIARLMGEAARRLDLEFDTGDRTQTLQRKIVDQLDEAVREAAARRRAVRSGSPAVSPDKRRMPKVPRQSAQPPDKARPAPFEPSTDAAEAGGGAADRRPASGEFRETRRAWGHLPLREREEILQGVGEKFLERYRAWIQRYYRALQEQEE